MQRPLNIQNYFEKEIKAGRLLLPDFKLTHEAEITVCYWHKNKHVDQ